MDLLILANTSFVKNYERILNAIDKLEHNLIGFISLDNGRLFETINDYNIYPIGYMNILKYDLALIDTDDVDNAKNFIIPALAKLNLPVNKIKTVYWLLQQIMINKYENFNDKTIQDTIAYWKDNELTVFNQHTEFYQHTFDEMYIDESCGLPFIIFKTAEGKDRRMYFPKNGGARVKGTDGKIYIKDILREQVPTSPHLYITGEHKINDGDVLIDAGVCEGNFALRYVDICSKVYLFEMDKNWFEPLYYSFRDCWDKVELIPKACTNATKMGGGGNR